jgi:hypothetical protein
MTVAEPVAPLDGGDLTLHTSLFGALVVPDGAARAEELRVLSARAAVYATKARGEGTLRAYRSAWRGFEAWCQSLGRAPLAGDPDRLWCRDRPVECLEGVTLG